MRRGLMITVIAAALVVSGTQAASAASTWAIQPTHIPADGVDGTLQAVSCTSAADCIAVGGYTSTAGTVPLAEYWDGTAWHVQDVPFPAGATFSDLDGVSCTSSTD